MFRISAKDIKLFDRIKKTNNANVISALNLVAEGFVKPDLIKHMETVFDRPTRFTLNSLTVSPAFKGRDVAYVWFKDPGRMSEHYLVPQVEGTERKSKGFERALGIGTLVPAAGAKLDGYGNISTGQLRQILSVIGSEGLGGYSFKMTKRSSKRNKKERDYFVITEKKNELYPGVYRRKEKGSKRASTGTHRAGQRGVKKKVVFARGVIPVLFVGGNDPYVARFDFYSEVSISINKNFLRCYAEVIESQKTK